MLRRIPAFARRRPGSGLPPSSASRDVPAFARRRPFSGLPPSSASRGVPVAGTRTGRTENNIQRHFGTGSSVYSKKDGQSVPASETSQKAAESQDKGKETSKKELLDIIKDMKVCLNTLNVQTTKPPGRKPSTNLAATVKDPPDKRSEFLSPELVAAVSAVADSLPLDKQTTKSELLKQLQQHEEKLRTQKDREKSGISFRHIISDMKIAKSTSARVSEKAQFQIQLDEEMYSSDQEKKNDFNKRRNLFKGKRLSIFDIKAFADEASAPEASPPSLWEIEYAKQLATVNEQPLENGFEELIQWTKEGKLWEFPINNEAGFDDDGSEFHEHVFLDKYLEGFPKQGPIRAFMELVTNGLSKNPYLSVKQKVEHIEWFRNYFNEKRDTLKENNIEFT